MELDDEPPLETAVLHVAACRPAMIYGVPYVMLVPVAVICLEIEMIFGIKLAILFDIPLLIIAFATVLYDYNAPGVWMVWARTSMIILDDHKYGGASIAAHPIKSEPTAPRGIPSDAWR
jgi:type IV secretion system protein VirB3